MNDLVTANRHTEAGIIDEVLADTASAALAPTEAAPKTVDGRELAQLVGDAGTAKDASIVAIKSSMADLEKRLGALKSAGDDLCEQIEERHAAFAAVVLAFGGAMRETQQAMEQQRAKIDQPSAA